MANWQGSIKAKPITKRDGATTVNFMNLIIFQFGIPNNIITDNGTNFTSEEFRDFCRSQGICVDFASVSHPQSNGHVERCNTPVFVPQFFFRGIWLPSFLFWYSFVFFGSFADVDGQMAMPFPLTPEILLDLSMPPKILFLGFCR